MYKILLLLQEDLPVAETGNPNEHIIVAIPGGAATGWRGAKLQWWGVARQEVRGVEIWWCYEVADAVSMVPLVAPLERFEYKSRSSSVNENYGLGVV